MSCFDFYIFYSVMPCDGSYSCLVDLSRVSVLCAWCLAQRMSMKKTLSGFLIDVEPMLRCNGGILREPSSVHSAFYWIHVTPGPYPFFLFLFIKI